MYRAPSMIHKVWYTNGMPNRGWGLGGCMNNVTYHCDMTMCVYCDVMSNDMKHLTCCGEVASTFTCISDENKQF